MFLIKLRMEYEPAGLVFGYKSKGIFRQFGPLKKEKLA